MQNEGNHVRIESEAQFLLPCQEFRISLVECVKVVSRECKVYELGSEVSDDWRLAHEDDQGSECK
jgi:hypothetical protein